MHFCSPEHGENGKNGNLTDRNRKSYKILEHIFLKVNLIQVERNIVEASGRWRSEVEAVNMQGFTVLNTCAPIFWEQIPMNRLKIKIFNAKNRKSYCYPQINFTVFIAKR